MRAAFMAVLILSAGCSRSQVSEAVDRAEKAFQRLQASWAPAAGSTSVGKGPSFVSYRHPEGLFAAERGADWSVADEAGGDVPSVIFLAPPAAGKKGSQVRESIAAFFYVRGNHLFRDPRTYIEAHTATEPGRSYGTLTAGVVAGRPSQEFTSEGPLPASKESVLKGREAARWVVLPVDGGFFVFQYSAPVENFARSQPVFDQFLQTFRTPG